MGTQVVDLDGRLVDSTSIDAAHDDLGFYRGRGLFETVLAVRGTLPFASGHFARLRNSARQAGLGTLPADEVVTERIASVLRANQLETAIARVNLRFDANSCLTLAREAAAALPRLRREGIDACTVALERARTAATHKWVEREQLRAASAKAQASGCQEALMIGLDGQVLEGATSNIFLVLDDEICTPPCDEGVLPGVTRQLVLDVAAQESIRTIQRSCNRDDIGRASELFISSAIRLVLAVNRVDGRSVGAGRPGPVSQRLGKLIIARAGL